MRKPISTRTSTPVIRPGRTERRHRGNGMPVPARFAVAIGAYRKAITPSESEIIPPGEIEDRPPATPPVAKSGDETKAQMARGNSDRSIEHRVMGNPRMPQPDAGGFHWGGSKGRAW